MSSSPIQRLFDELKRRKVFRVAGVYAVVGWALLQVADVLGPALLLPEVVTRAVAFLVILGFPVALVLAWAFEVTPDGVRKTERKDGSPAAASSNGWFSKRAAVGAAIVVLLGIGGTWLAVGSGFAGSSPPAGETLPRSVAVLPFANMSGAEENEYFSDGLAEEILNLLAKVDELKVPARTSSFAYKGRNEDVREIARALDVGAVLEGSVRRADNQIRVSAQLIQASDGYHLWSETYDRELKDIFAIQEDIARKIVHALQVELGMAPEEAVGRRRPTDDLEAYQLFLQARHLFHQRTEESLLRSADLYNEALERDPDFAEAWVGLATTHVVIPGYAEPEYDSRHRALVAVERGLALDSTIALGYAVLGNLRGDEGDLLGGYRAYERALELDPDAPTILLWSAITQLGAGRIEEGARLIERAFALDPASGVITGWRGHVAFLRGDLEAAMDAYRRSIELTWGAGGFWFCMVALASDRYAELGSECRTDGSGGGASRVVTTLGMARAVADGEEGARERMFELEPLDGILLGPAWDRPDMFFRGLEALDGSASNLATVAMWRPEAAEYRRDSRFTEWVERMGLPDYWDEAGWPDACSRMDSGNVRCR